MNKKKITPSKKSVKSTKKATSIKNEAPKPRRGRPPAPRILKAVERKPGKVLTAEGWFRTFKKLNPLKK